VRPGVDERPLTPWGPRGAGPRRSPQGGGARKRMGFGEGPAAEFCRTMIQSTARMGAGVVCSMTPSCEGEGPYPKGARPPTGPGRGG